jgi:hypothetical protein
MNGQHLSVAKVKLYPVSINVHRYSCPVANYYELCICNCAFVSCAFVRVTLIIKLLVIVYLVSKYHVFRE